MIATRALHRAAAILLTALGLAALPAAHANPGDTITIGSNEFVFLWDSEAAPDELAIDRRLRDHP